METIDAKRLAELLQEQDFINSELEELNNQCARLKRRLFQIEKMLDTSRSWEL